MSLRLPVTPHGHVGLLWWSLGQSIVTHISPQGIRNPNFKNVQSSIFDTLTYFREFFLLLCWRSAWCSWITIMLKIMYRSIPKPPIPPRANPGAFDFLEKFWSNSPLCCQLDGQMPHPLELQRGSNPPPSRHVKAATETSSAKFSATTNFLFSLSSLHT